MYANCNNAGYTSRLYFHRKFTTDDLHYVTNVQTHLVLLTSWLLMRASVEHIQKT